MGDTSMSARIQQENMYQVRMIRVSEREGERYHISTAATEVLLLQQPPIAMATATSTAEVCVVLCRPAA